MSKDTRELFETASQTAGPYVHIGLSPRAAGFDIYEEELGTVIAGPGTQGEKIRIAGVVWDGNGDPVKDVLLEVWQPNSKGVFANEAALEPDFRGWGRIISDFETGDWAFETIKPGTNGKDAPHIKFWIVARGINIGLHTRMYFDDLSDLNETDPTLAMLETEQYRETLIAKSSISNGLRTYRFDIRLQGDGETVFFDV